MVNEVFPFCVRAKSIGPKAGKRQEHCTYTAIYHTKIGAKLMNGSAFDL